MSTNLLMGSWGNCQSSTAATPIHPHVQMLKMKEVMSSISSRISAVILTLNEEETISRAISTLTWCDEVFVVDSDSHDRTREIATASGASVYVHKQDGPFLISDQRNWAISNLPIESEWILFLDADEECTPEFRDEILRVISMTRLDAYYAAPAFMYYGKWLKHISGFPNWHPRLIRRKSSISFTGGVWEDFCKKNSAGYISSPYIHETNAKGLEDWIAKHFRYAHWESMKIIGYSSPDASDRRGLLRSLRYRLGPLRKYIAILYLFIVRKGFLDGAEGRSYLRRMFIYELLIDELKLELETREMGDGIK